MRLLRFDTAASQSVEDWGSRAVAVCRLAHLSGEADVSCLHFASDAVLGGMPASGTSRLARPA